MVKFLLVVSLLVIPCIVRAADGPVAAVDHLDLDRYLGRWYEIARYPMWFQRKCAASMAEYSLRDDGMISVVNSCTRVDAPNKVKRATGRARIVDETTNAKLEVSFFGPFWADYWVIDLAPDYRWAVVGEGRRKYLWILSRTPELPQADLDGILERLRAAGYDPDRLVWDDHAGAPLPG
jgi:apolipoprotein D and lipocalin family protein